MNLLKSIVTKVLGDPVRHTYKSDDGTENEYYLTPVESDCWGDISNTKVMTNTLEQAKAIKVGYEWESWGVSNENQANQDEARTL
nr:hypothetical protein [Providencia rettgeri]